jgi:hypothetical protein
MPRYPTNRLCLVNHLFGFLQYHHPPHPDRTSEYHYKVQRTLQTHAKKTARIMVRGILFSFEKEL